MINGFTDSYREWLKFRKKFPKYPSSWAFSILELLWSHFSICRVFPKNLILMAGKLQFGMELSILKCLYVIYYYHILQLNQTIQWTRHTLYKYQNSLFWPISHLQGYHYNMWEDPHNHHILLLSDRVRNGLENLSCSFLCTDVTISYKNRRMQLYTIHITLLALCYYNMFQP